MSTVYIVIIAISVLALMICRTEMAVIFFFSSLLSSYITLGIQPWLTSLFVQFVPEYLWQWSAVITMLGVYVLLLAILFFILCIVFIIKKGFAAVLQMPYPAKLGKLISLVCIFGGMMAFCGILLLSASSLPHIDKVPAVKRQKVAAIGRKIATRSITLVQLGNAPSANQLFWLENYPDVVYMTGHIDNLNGIKHEPPAEESAENAEEADSGSSDPGSIAKLKASRKARESE